MSGRRLGPEEAQAAGIVSSLVDDADAGAAAVAKRLLKAAPKVQHLVRRLVEEVTDLSLDEALRHSLDEWLRLIRSDERIEGHTAFVEKRDPDWVKRTRVT